MIVEPIDPSELEPEVEQLEPIDETSTTDQIDPDEGSAEAVQVTSSDEE